jgi:hypothetical protein
MRIPPKPFKPGEGGRPKGSKNKFTSLKDKFILAFEKTGDVKGLVDWIKKNPKNRAAFYQMITKLFPVDIAHSGEIKTTVTFIMPRPGKKKDADATTEHNL